MAVDGSHPPHRSQAGVTAARHMRSVLAATRLNHYSATPQEIRQTGCPAFRTREFRLYLRGAAQQDLERGSSGIGSGRYTRTQACRRTKLATLLGVLSAIQF
jgi:hypothetical protein